MPENTSPDFDQLLDFAHRLADASAGQTLPLFRQPIDIDNKDTEAGFDPVTEADRAAERIMRDMVAEHWPDHDFEGEEFENHDRDAEYTWCVDPIDGTRSFIMGIPIWGTLIGLKKSGSPIMGMMSQPFTGERYWSTETETRYTGPEGDRILTTRKCSRLEDAVLATTDPGLFGSGYAIDKFNSLAQQTRLNRYGGDCYAYCMLAAGRCDLVMETDLKPFDIVALIPLVERAGGIVTTWTGGDAAIGGNILASGDPALHDRLLRVLSG